MKANVPLGASAEVSLKASPETLASYVGSGGLDVFSTPWMIALMERAAAAAAEPCLDSAFTTVGISVDVRHLAGTPPGATVKAVAKLISADGARLTFEVRAEDPWGLIGEGRHERMIVDADRFLGRVSGRASGAPGNEEGR